MNLSFEIESSTEINKFADKYPSSSMEGNATNLKMNFVVMMSFLIPKRARLLKNEKHWQLAQFML